MPPHVRLTTICVKAVVRGTPKTIGSEAVSAPDASTTTVVTAGGVSLSRIEPVAVFGVPRV